MTDPIIITNLIITACSVVLIPVIIKGLDLVHELITHIKHSECCLSKIDMKDIMEDKKKIIEEEKKIKEEEEKEEKK